MKQRVDELLERNDAMREEKEKLLTEKKNATESLRKIDQQNKTFKVNIIDGDYLKSPKKKV